ncbi:PTS system mannose/fructose/sorbose family transporter subunit IID [Vagococcus sp.]|uniref:PTS system mannose/fructose/sorbose family transporter subunit IID n=1 Tax=Vagococcus sp. TaxID=1933889 RepID=UPI003F98DAAC
MEEKKLLDKKTLTKSYNNWMKYNLVAMSFEFLEALGFALSMEPVADKLYKDEPEKKKEMMQRHTVFYNTEPQAGALVTGIAVGLEEQKALGNTGVTGDLINGLKIGLMGPIAGIGDSMIPGMLIPILLSIGMGLSSNGSPLGVLFYVITYNLIMYFGTRFLFFKGYELGAESIDIFTGEKAQQITRAITVLGMTVIGGVAASYVNVDLKAKVALRGAEIDIQSILDGIFPKLLPLAIIFGSWYLMSKKKVSPVKLILIYFIVAFVGVGIGYLFL